jgi:CheY-like chemotaxis protein
MSIMPHMQSSTATAAVTELSNVPQVLVIDSREHRLEMMSLALSESWEDIVVLSVPDVEAALHLVETRAARPILIVLAAGFASAETVECLRRLKSDAMVAEIPTMVLSSSLSSSELQRLTRLGASDVLREPETLDGYLRLVSGWQALLSRS